jgi:hypothetical protein
MKHRAQGSIRRFVVGGVAAILGLAAIAGCSDDKSSDEGEAADPISAPAVATFEVADSEQFKIELDTDELVEHARQLLEGESVAAIPLGTVVRDDPGVNAPWTWHIDPATLEFADVTIEVCDGLPSFVEDGTVTSDQYCPWSAKVIALEPL